MANVPTPIDGGYVYMLRQVSAGSTYVKFHIYNGWNITKHAVPVVRTTGGTQVGSLVLDVPAYSDSGELQISGLSPSTTYTLYLHEYPNTAAVNSVTFTTPASGSGESAAGYGNVSASKTVNWANNTTVWGDALTVVSSWGAQQKTGAVLNTITDNGDGTCTISLQTTSWSKWYQGYPWHYLKVSYTDVDNTSRQYLEIPAGSTTGANRNSDIDRTSDGVYSNSYWHDAWVRKDITITYPQKDTAYNRVITIVIGNLGGYPSNQPSNPISTFTNTLKINVTIPASSVYIAQVGSDAEGTATVSNGSTTSGEYVYVNRNSTATYTAMPSTNYVFGGWYDYSSNELISSSNPLPYTVTSGLYLIAKYDEDLTDKALYLDEHVTQKSYRLKDASKAHGSGTSGRIARWTDTDTLANNWLVTAGNPPSTVTNGDIYVKNSESGYPNYSSWQAGNQVYIDPQLAYAAIKVVFVSETSTTYTVEIHTSAYGGGYTGGFNEGTYDWSLKISNNGGTSYTSIAGASNTWCLFNGSGGWLGAGSPGIYDNTAYVINKTSSAQSIKLQVSNTFHGYGTSSKEISFTVPPTGLGPCVGQSGSWHRSNVFIHNGTEWKQAVMYVYDGTQWVKSHYY